MSVMHDAALSYAARGWAVFPLWWIDEATGRCACGAPLDEEGNPTCSAGKHPLGALVPQGFRNASTNPIAIRHWWGLYPQANIGAATGDASDFDALDVDTKHEGLGSWQALRDEHGELPEGTATTTTPSGGRHYYFRHARGLTNRRGALPRGIDVRGSGGYVVLPPSIALGQDGRPHPYVWNTEPADVLTDWTAWLIRLIASEPNTPTSRQNGQGDASIPQRQYATPYDLGETFSHGERNLKLISLAGTLLRRGLPEEAIANSLLSVNEIQCIPPLPENEVRGVAHSVMNYTPPDEEQFPRTDVGNARRIALRYATDMRYCHKWHTWMIWTGTQWIKDGNETIMNRARQSVLELEAEAIAIDNAELRGEQRAYALRCQTDIKLNAAIRQCRSLPEIVVDHEVFDSQPWLLNVANGTIDLETGELLPHNPDHYLMHKIRYIYDPKAKAPLWERSLLQCFQGNVDLVDYFQRMLGYGLTGSTISDKFFVWWGSGSNGKSTIQDTLLRLLKPFASTAETNLLMTRTGEAHPTGMADLFGKRLVFASESGQDKNFNEAIVKQLTGGDVIKARRMREDFWEFRPSHKIILVTNHKPNVKDSGHGFWRRMSVIPWTARFEKTGKKNELEETLISTEAEGILAWLVQGCLKWAEDTGFQNEPAIVTEAIQEYQQEQDVLGSWLSYACEEGTLFEETSATMHAAYCAWLHESGWRNTPTIQTFGRDLSERGYQRKADNPHLRVGIRFKRGDLRLISNEEAPKRADDIRQARFEP
jgi:putative DNA primase/helicase